MRRPVSIGQGIHRKERENRKSKTLLTHTGLLMEGVDQHEAPEPWNRFREIGRR